ncbi:hypothetical protein BH11VER1_BH11VER1_24200 [soil metagenome]
MADEATLDSTCPFAVSIEGEMLLFRYSYPYYQRTS